MKKITVLVFIFFLIKTATFAQSTISGYVYDAQSREPLVISGPNTGGKTVLLKTVGTLVLMAQSGIVPPVGAGTRLPWHDAVYADIGDTQSIARDLSTFTAHLARLKAALEGAGPGTLILVDEIGASTDPAEGSALAVRGKRLERPMVPLVLEHRRIHTRRPCRALLDPGGENGDLVVGKRGAFRRHADFLVIAADKADQMAGRGLAGDNVRNVVLASLQRGLADVEPESGFLLFRAVAPVATFLENGPNIADEVHGGHGGGAGRQGEEKRGKGEDSGQGC